MLQAPPDVPPDLAAEFEEVRASIQASVSAQEQVAVAHYLRLVREGRLPAEAEDQQLLAGLPAAERDEVEEEREQERDAQEAVEMEEMRACREVALGEMSAPPAVWDSLTAVGYNGTEAIEVLRWVETMDKAAREGRLNLPAACVPAAMRSKWGEGRGVETWMITGAEGGPGALEQRRWQKLKGRAHLERVWLSCDDSRNSERSIAGLVYHPFVAPEGEVGLEGRAGCSGSLLQKAEQELAQQARPRSHTSTPKCWGRMGWSPCRNGWAT